VSVVKPPAPTPRVLQKADNKWTIAQ